MPKKEKNEASACPFVFEWATFCGKVLADGKSRSLIDVMPSYQLKVEYEGEVNEPAVINVGEMAIYALLSRSPEVQGEVNTELDLLIKAGEKEVEKKLPAKLTQEEINLQVTVKLPSVSIAVDLSKEEYSSEIVGKFSFGNKELGTARIPLTIKSRQKKS